VNDYENADLCAFKHDIPLLWNPAETNPTDTFYKSFFNKILEFKTWRLSIHFKEIRFGSDNFVQLVLPMPITDQMYSFTFGNLALRTFGPSAVCSVAIFGEISPFWGNFGSKWGNFLAFWEIPHLGKFQAGQFFWFFMY